MTVRVVKSRTSYMDYPPESSASTAPWISIFFIVSTVLAISLFLYVVGSAIWMLE